jgi:hypothetical protein
MTTNGKIILIQAGQPARTIDHQDTVELEQMYDYLKVDCIAAKRLGRMPIGESRYADAWFDDEGLLKSDTIDEHGEFIARENMPNRRIGPETVIFGSILICACNEAADSVALTEDEAAVCMKLVEEKWAQLPADFPRPEATIEFVPMEKL